MRFNLMMTSVGALHITDSDLLAIIYESDRT